LPISIYKIYKGQIKIDLEMINSFIEYTYFQNEQILNEIDNRYNNYYDTIENEDQFLSYLEDKSFIHSNLFNKHLFNSYFSILTAFFERSLSQIFNFYYELNLSDPDSSIKGKFRIEEAEKTLTKILKINLVDLKEEKAIILYYRDLRHLLVHCDSNLKFANKKSKNLISRIRKDKRIAVDKQTNEIRFPDLSCIIEYKLTLNDF
jgi:hypothetical protein